MTDTTTIYITRRVRTSGIVKVEAEINDKGYAHYSKNVEPKSCTEYLHPNWYRLTLPEAIEDAEFWRAQEISDLQRQIDDLKAIDLTKVREG